MKGEKEIEMSDMKTEDEKETDIDAEIEKANVKMVSFGELVSNTPNSANYRLLVNEKVD